MLLNAGGNGKDVRVKNYVFGREMHLLSEQLVCPFTNLYPTLVTVGLALLVKCHDHNSSAVSFNFFSPFDELFFTLFQTDGVHNGLPLHTLKPCLDNFPLRTVDHDRQPGDIRLRGHQVQKGYHLLFCIQHGIVHVHIDNLCPAFYLASCHVEGLLVFLLAYEPCKLTRPCHIGSLTHIYEVCLF